MEDPLEPVALTTERLVLRPLTADDVDAVFAACQDPEIQRWTTVPAPYERSHAEQFVHGINPVGWREGTFCNFGSFRRDTGALVSSIGPMDIRRSARVAEIGFWTAKWARGNGFTVEAVRAVAEWTFIALGMERLTWQAEVGNVGSRAVAEKAGFTVEGVLRAQLLYRGTRRDVWIGSLLPSDLGLSTDHPYLPASEIP
jgi:RimJ/RimL family protein N-acetyltransferase